MSGGLLAASRCSVAGEPRIAVSIDEPKYFSTQLERKRNPPFLLPRAMPPFPKRTEPRSARAQLKGGR